MDSFLNEIENDQKNINNEICKEDFKYPSPSFLVKDLYKNNQNDKIIKYINKSLADLRKSLKSKKVPKDENPENVADIVKKILDFNKHHKGKGTKTLNPKQIFQRFTIALA